MSNLSTQSYKGARDYYPDDKRLQNYIFNVWKRTVESFGYEEYGAPLLEPIELYLAKSGQELAGEQTYLFTDRGGRQVAIRPEITPTISRMVAQRRQELAMPARLYSIANCMRFERPQRGRTREFWQLNADLFGADGPAADAEIIELSHAVLLAFGATQDMFTIRVNNRDLINQLMTQFLGLDLIGATMMTKLLDKKDKLPVEEFKTQALAIFGEQAAVGLPKLAKLITMKSLDNIPQELQELPSVRQLDQVLTTLRRKGITNAVFDVTLMRGLDYYTGTVFEVFDTSPDNNRSLFGGGRYDGLVGLFGVESVPTVGVAPGEETTTLFLQTHNLLPQLTTHTDAYIIPINEDSFDGADALAKQLRDNGVNVELDVTGRKVEKQLKTAIKKHIPFAVFVGENEITEGIYTVKNLIKSTEQKVDATRMVTVVKDHRYDGDEDAAFEI